MACILLVVSVHAVDARLLLYQRSSPTTISGLARIIDGDTLELPNKQFVRLFGIDAPESNQCCTRSSSSTYTCGISSKTSLSNKIDAQPVTCTTTGKPDKYGRTIGTCKNSKGVELNKWLVSRGWAVAYYGTKVRNYTKQEQQAAARKVGMWGGGFQRPAEFRKSPLPGSKTVGGKCPLLSSPPSPPRSPPPTTPSPSPSSPPSSPGVPDCPDPIKGNINSKREKIYHTVKSPYYKITTIEVEKGERWFCTEAEAIRAGWRAAGGGSTPPPPGDDNDKTPSPPPGPPSPPPPTSYTEEPNCPDPIKGNINSKKEKIYHTVKSRYYKITTIEPEKGERWFCYEADAIAFGWRAPR